MLACVFRAAAAAARDELVLFSFFGGKRAVAGGGGEVGTKRCAANLPRRVDGLGSYDEPYS